MKKKRKIKKLPKKELKKVKGGKAIRVRGGDATADQIEALQGLGRFFKLNIN